jgi:hypothetical protein
MNVRAGDLRQVTINGREFDPAPESGCTILPGGFANEHALTGNGKNHVTQKRQKAGINELSVSIDDSREDLEFLKDIADSGESVPVTATLASGMAYSGPLILVAEDLGKDTAEGTATFSLVGEKFEQI